MDIVVLEGAAGQPPMTVLTGLLDDQAALMGLLEHLYARGIPLLKVERLNDEQDDHIQTTTCAPPDASQGR